MCLGPFKFSLGYHQSHKTNIFTSLFAQKGILIKMEMASFEVAKWLYFLPLHQLKLNFLQSEWISLEKRPDPEAKQFFAICMYIHKLRYVAQFTI